MSEIRKVEMVPKEVVTSTVCDACGAVRDNPDPPGWVHLASAHSDWGNDSAESYERFDACSPPCFFEVTRRIVRNYGRHTNPTLRIEPYFDIQFLDALHAAVGEVV